MWNCNNGKFKILILNNTLFSYKLKLNFYNKKIGELANMFTGHEYAANYGGFTPDGKLIVTCSDDKSVRVWKP
jgi:WD40 repeat protein